MTDEPRHGLDEVIARFVEACRADERIVAAFLAGSHARGDADAHSDLDLCLIATDEGRDDLWAERAAFIDRLGEVLFLEDFDTGTTAFFILADGTEAELAFGARDRFREIHSGPYRVLFDREGFLDGATFPSQEVPPDEQLEVLRRIIHWFWHDLSHFVAAIGRGQLWWAAGQLEILRRSCVNLVRLDVDFGAPVEDYDKVDVHAPPDRLEPLRATFVPMESQALLDAARVCLELHADLGPRLAQAHGLPYPAGLERIMRARVASLG